MTRLRRFLPFLSWPRPSGAVLRGDALAGITVGLMVIPQGVAFATLGMTALVLIFGEVLPKTLSITYPEAVATRVAPVVRVLILIFSPAWCAWCKPAISTGMRWS